MKRLIMVLVLVMMMVASLTVMAQDDMSDATIKIGGNADLGVFLVDSEGMTLYTFNNDEPGVSNCVDDCAVAWPPLTVGEGEVPTLDYGVPGVVSVIERPDGSLQVTHNGWPLYYWQDDAAPGDATGQGLGDVWYVAYLPTVGLGGNTELGTFITGPDGMTLYIFDNDEENVSNCTGDCAVAWPPLTVGSEDELWIEPGLPGELGTIEREDGSLQVVWDGIPLYYWQDDAAPGDATGHGVGEVWFVISPYTLSSDEDEELGEYLYGPNGMTLYTFANDEEGVSNCVDECAAFWPPLTVAEGETPSTETLTGEIGVIEREDGRLQVTYNGMPLYYWYGDVVPADITGHGVGDVWFVAQP